MATRHVRRLTPLVLLATGMLTGGASATSTLDVAPHGGIVANGAGVEIPLSVTCDAPGPGGVENLFVSVRQAVGDVIASGTGSVDGGFCDGTAQEVVVAVFADPGSRPFRGGDAVLQASLAVCSGVLVPYAAEPAYMPPRPAPAPPDPPADPVPVPPAPPADPAPVPPLPGPEPVPVPPCQTTTVNQLVFLHPVEPAMPPVHPHP